MSFSRDSCRLGEGLLCAALALGLLAACGDPQPPVAGNSPPLATELVFYDWAEDMPQSVLDAFNAEFGVKVIYETYETTEEAIGSLQGGKVYDLMIVDSPFVPGLVSEGLIVEIDPRNVPNIRNISANFRELVFDPGNRYSVTYTWGLTGLIVRADRISQAVTRWGDLWDPGYTGHVLVWDMPRDLLGIALKSLGFSINSEDPAELEAALQHLLALRAGARTTGYAPEVAKSALATGDAVLMPGWAGDLLRARAHGLDVRFVLPAEGSIQWGDNFVIPKSSTRKYTAEVFLNFLLRPEISAQIVNEQFYATANEAAYPFIKPEIRNDPAIFPPLDEVRRAQVIMPLSPSGKALYDRIWQRYLAGPSGPSGRDQ